MSKKVFNMQGGKHSAAAYSELEKWAYGSCVASATSFVVSAGTGMNLNISTGAGIISDTIARRIGTDAVETATVPTASATYNRIDAVVAYIDTAVSPTTAVTDNTNDILKFVVVAGTAAASPVAPNDSAIQSAIGAGKPFMRLYDVTVPQNATNTSGMTFTDRRSFPTAQAIADAIVTAAKLASNSVTTAKIANAAVTAAKLDFTTQKPNNSTSWTGVSYGSGWTDYDASSFTPGQYYKDITGIVYLRGVVKRTSGTGTLIGTLPVGFRPLKTVGGGAYGDGGLANVQVESNGQINLVSGSTGGFIYLDRFFFFAEQ